MPRYINSLQSLFFNRSNKVLLRLFNTLNPDKLKTFFTLVI